MRYLTQHHVETTSLPHIGVVDPRTQRLLWHHEGLISTEDLTTTRESPAT